MLDLDFWNYFAATGCCVGLLMSLVAAFELSRHIARVTPFTHDVFACFVCSIYLHDGVFGVSRNGKAEAASGKPVKAYGPCSVPCIAQATAAVCAKMAHMFVAHVDL